MCDESEALCSLVIACETKQNNTFIVALILFALPNRECELKQKQKKQKEALRLARQK